MRKLREIISFIQHVGSCHFQLSFTRLYFINFTELGVRSLANASRARQFKPLNPPGVGWVKFFFLRLEYLSAHACQIWVRTVAKDF